MPDFTSSLPGFGSSSSGSGSSATLTQEQKKEAIISQVRNELAMANAQELINKMNEKCYEKCITSPGTALSSKEQTCLSRCMDRYLEAFNIVSRAYVARVGKERGSMADASLTA